MNKIFKIIWNKTTQRLEVVSELAKSQGKAKATTDKRADVVGTSKLTHAFSLTALALSVLTLSNEAFAASNGQISYVEVNSSKAGSLATGTDSIAIGPTASAATASSIAIGDGATVNERGLQGIAIGSNATAGANNATVIGRDTLVGRDATDSVAIGLGSVVTCTSATAIGKNANASGRSSISIGQNTLTTQDATVAVGYNVSATGINATTIGSYNNATGDSATALGYKTTAGS
ncbi:ESPR-type extended signal peptide-containing protein [Haemophilus haemolyticus]